MVKLSPFTFSYRVQTENSQNSHSIAYTFKTALQSAAPIEIQSHGLYLITGPSGSGKSTLLGLIKKLLPHYTPSEFKGQIDFTDEFAQIKHSEIVYLFQNPFHQIIHNNVSLELAFTAENQLLPFSLYQKRINEILQQNGLTDLKHRKTSTLSHGQAQKILLSSLLVTQPKILLLDEPTAFMDPRARKEFYTLLEQLKNTHLILIVDHHLNEISEICTHILKINSDKQLHEITQEIWLKELQQQNLQLLNLQTHIHDKTAITLHDKKENFKIEAHDLDFSYNKKQPLLTNLNFSWSSGEIITIQGASGSGKSTLFKILSGFYKTSSQKLKFLYNDQEIATNEAQKHMGYVLQNSEENFIYDTVKKELQNTDLEQINSLLSQVNLEQSPYNLSEGEKRRVSFLIHQNQKNKVLFFDEPTFGLDQKKVIEVAQIILNNKSQGKLQIIISHDLNFINMVADKKYELKEGQLHDL